MLLDNYMYRPAAVYRLAGFFRWITFANYLKADFRGENVREFVVTQCTTPTSAVSNCLKIDFRRQKNTRKSPQKREIRESFPPKETRYKVLHLGTVRAKFKHWHKEFSSIQYTSSIVRTAT